MGMGMGMGRALVMRKVLRRPRTLFIRRLLTWAGLEWTPQTRKYLESRYLMKGM